MLVITGTKFVGDIDHVPGLFRVATRCHHIYYVPVIPTGTHLVLDFTEEDVTKWWHSGNRSVVETIPLPWSWKSLGIAYLRAALGIGVFACLVKAFFAGMSVAWFVAAAAAALLLWISRLSGRASRERALELGAIAGIPRELVLRHVHAPAKKRERAASAQPLPRAKLVKDVPALVPRPTPVAPPPPQPPPIAPNEEPRLLL